MHLPTRKKYLKEITIRLIYVIWSLILSFCISYTYSNELIHIFTRPLKQAYLTNYTVRLDMLNDKLNFIFTDLTEAFTATFYVSIFVTIYVLIFTVAYQIWLFIQPGLYKYEKQQIWYSIILSSLISVISFLSVYYLILPAACKFFLSYEINLNTDLQVKLEPKILTYLTTILKFFMCFQIFLQIPVCIFLFIKIGLLPNSHTILNQITKKRQIYHFIFFFFSGLISPFDLLIQFIILFFCVLTYEVTIFILIWQENKNLKRFWSTKTF